MNALSSRIFAVAVALMAATFSVEAEEEKETTRWLRQLESPDMAVRLQAIEALQTSLDPRIPGACLAALRGEGDTVRRLALRAIGSRWHQIPKSREGDFTAAITPHLRTADEGLANMASRARALITRDYDSPMVSVSRNRRWVIYERRGLPCLIDTRTSTEELLGWPMPEADMFSGFKPRMANREVQPVVHWHPRQEMVALEIFLHRRASTLWVWRYGAGLKVFAVDDLLAAVGHRRDEIREVAGFHAREPKWKGATLEFQLEFTLERGSEEKEMAARLQWNPATDTLRELSRRQLP